MSHRLVAFALIIEVRILQVPYRIYVLDDAALQPVNFHQHQPHA